MQRKPLKPSILGAMTLFVEEQCVVRTAVSLRREAVLPANLVSLGSSMIFSFVGVLVDRKGKGARFS